MGNIAQTNAQGTQYLVSTSSTYHLGDALNSTRQLTDASGQVTLTQSYDPFGNVNYQTGSGQSLYGYTSEQTDADGLIYLRARYYNPYLNQFISPDRIIPDQSNPQSWQDVLVPVATCENKCQHRQRVDEVKVQNYKERKGLSRTRQIVLFWIQHGMLIERCQPNDRAEQ